MHEFAGYSVETAESTYPITLAEAKADLNILHTDDDTYITSLIIQVSESFERHTWTSLISRTYTAKFKRFPYWQGEVMKLRFPPLISVQSITYLETDGTPIVWNASNYEVVIDRDVGYIRLAFEKDYPVDVRDHQDSITVEFTAGYADADAVPNAIKKTLLMWVTHWYTLREPIIAGTTVAEVPKTLEWLIDRYAVRHTGTHEVSR